MDIWQQPTDVTHRDSVACWFGLLTFPTCWHGNPLGALIPEERSPAKTGRAKESLRRATIQITNVSRELHEHREDASRQRAEPPVALSHSFYATYCTCTFSIVPLNLNGALSQ